MTVVLFLFRGLLDFRCPKIPVYWEPIFHLVFLDRVFFYFKQFLNKVLYFKSVMSSEICLAVLLLLGVIEWVLTYSHLVYNRM